MCIEFRRVDICIERVNTSLTILFIIFTPTSLKHPPAQTGHRSRHHAPPFQHQLPVLIHTHRLRHFGRLLGPRLGPREVGQFLLRRPRHSRPGPPLAPAALARVLPQKLGLFSWRGRAHEVGSFEHLLGQLVKLNVFAVLFLHEVNKFLLVKRLVFACPPLQINGHRVVIVDELPIFGPRHRPEVKGDLLGGLEVALLVQTAQDLHWLFRLRQPALSLVLQPFQDV